jgi:O-antigen ligase
MSALQRHQVALVYGSAAAISVPAGIAVARAQENVSMSLLALVVLAGAAVAVSLPPTTLFVGWLVLAPLFQSSADVSAMGRGLTWALYIGPAVLLGALAVFRRNPSIPFERVDWLPGLYAAYTLASIALTTDLLRANTTGTAKAFFIIVAIGAIVYYYLTIGPGAEIPSRTIVVALMIAVVVQSLMAIVEYATGWNLWDSVAWQDVYGGSRVVATLANPGVLGMFVGAGIVVAVAILTWEGPRALHRLSWGVVALGTPALLMTLTRGPILATACALVLVLLLGRKRLLGVGVLALGALVVALMLPSFQKTDLYEQRVTDRVNVRFREAVRDLSLELAAEKPVFGWGYGSFDRVKSASGYYAPGVSIKSIIEDTSHDTYLTTLVELGVVGLLLLVGPFVLVILRAAQRIRAPDPDRWILAASLGALIVIFISASTLDFRFFSFAQMLPFVFLAILRRATRGAPAQGDA